MLPCHLYQQKMCRKLNGRPLVNLGCKEDPAQLGKLHNATNVDVNDYDPQERLSLYSVPNFVRASILDMPFADEAFGLAVMGEVLEHMQPIIAAKAFLEIHRVLRDDGLLILTFPLDARPKEVQHAPEHLIVWEHGVTSWHSCVWLPELFDPLVKDGKFRELTEHREILEYGHCQGVGTVLVKA